MKEKERLEKISERYIGERARAIWDTFTPEQKEALMDDAEESQDREWSDRIDAMGEDA